MKLINETKGWILNVAPEATVDVPNKPVYSRDLNKEGEYDLLGTEPDEDFLEEYTRAGLSILDD